MHNIIISSKTTLVILLITDIIMVIDIDTILIYKLLT